MSKYSVTASIRLQHDAKSLADLRTQATKALSGLQVSLNTKNMGVFARQLKDVEKASSQVGRSLAEISAQSKVMGKGFADVGNVLGKLGNGNGKQGKGFGLVTASANQAAAAIKQITGATVQLNNGLSAQNGLIQKVSSSWGSMISSSLLVYGAYSKINDTIKENISLVEESINLGQIRNKRIGSPEIKEIVGQSRGLSERLGTTGGPSKLLGAYSQLEQAGIKDPKLMESLAKLSKNKQVQSLETIADLMVVINNSWGLKNQGQVETYFNKLIKASQDSKASVESLADGSSILNNVVEQLSGSYESIFAILAKGEDITGRSATEIARTMNTVFSNMLTKPDLAGLLESYNVSLFKFDEKTGTKQFNDPIKNLKKIKVLIDSLGGPNSLAGSSVVEQVAGVRRTPIFSGILKALDEIQSYENELKNNISDPINQGVLISLDSITTKLNQLSTTFTNTIGKISENRALQTLGKTFLDISSSVLKLVDSFSGLVPLLAMLGIGKMLGGKMSGIPMIGKSGPGIGKMLGGIAPKNQFSQTPDKIEINRFIDLVKQEIMVKYKGITAQKAEQYAINETVDQMKKGVRLYTNFNGTIQRATLIQQKMINTKQYVGNAIKNNAFGIGAVGLAGMAEFGGNGAESQGIQAGGQIGLMAGMMGVNPMVSALAGATVGISRWSDAVMASIGVIEKENIVRAQSRQTEIEQTGGKDSALYFQNMLSKYVNQAQLESAVGQKYTELSTWDRNALAVQNVRTGKSMQSLYDERTKTTADESRKTLAPNIQTDVAEIVKKFGIQSLEQFQSGAGRNIMTTGNAITPEFPKIVSRIIAEVNKQNKVEESAKVASPPYDTTLADKTRNYFTKNKNLSGLNNVGTDSFNEAVGQLGGDFDKEGLLALNKIKQIMPNLLKKGFNREDMVPAIRDGLLKAGIGESVVNTLTGELQKVDFEQISAGTADTAKITDDLINVGFGGLLEKSIQAKDALVEFSGELVESLNTLAEQRNRVADSQNEWAKSIVEIQKTANGFAGGSAGKFAGTGNALAQQQATILGQTSSVEELGKKLSTLQDLYEKNAGREFAQNSILSVITNVRSALQKLGDTSSRTTDIFDALNEENQKTLSQKNFVKGFYTSDTEGRRKMVRGMRATSQITQSGGSLNDVLPQLQAEIISTLESLGTSPFAGSGGKSADKVLDELLSRSTGIDFVGGSDKTKDLQGKLISTMTDSSNALRALAISEAEQMNILFRGLADENKRFLDSLSLLFSETKTVPPAVPFSDPADTAGLFSVPDRISMGSKSRSSSPSFNFPSYLKTLQPKKEQMKKRSADGFVPGDIYPKNYSYGSPDDMFDKIRKPDLMYKPSPKQVFENKGVGNYNVKDKMSLGEKEKANTYQASFDKLVGGLNSFGTRLDSIADKFNSLQITMKGEHNVNLSLNGISVLAQLTEGVRDMVLGLINKALMKYTSDNGMPIPQ